MEVQTDIVGGRQVIRPNDLVHCNIRYHTPYLARLDKHGEFEWQDKEYFGYGKHAAVYYVVENLEAGDYIQCAGGSGGNKYPFKGEVIERTETTLAVRPIDSKEWSNLVARLKKSKPTEPLPTIKPPY